jgi:hypothetical protein
VAEYVVPEYAVAEDRTAEYEDSPPDGLVELVGETPEQPSGRHARPDPVADNAPVVLRDDRRLSSVDLAFPFTSSLAASLHDELFTHRSVTT